MRPLNIAPQWQTRRFYLGPDPHTGRPLLYYTSKRQPDGRGRPDQAWSISAAEVEELKITESVPSPFKSVSNARLVVVYRDGQQLELKPPRASKARQRTLSDASLVNDRRVSSSGWLRRMSGMNGPQPTHTAIGPISASEQLAWCKETKEQILQFMRAKKPAAPSTVSHRTEDVRHEERMIVAGRFPVQDPKYKRLCTPSKLGMYFENRLKTALEPLGDELRVGEAGGREGVEEIRNVRGDLLWMGRAWKLADGDGEEFDVERRPSELFVRTLETVKEGMVIVQIDGKSAFHGRAGQAIQNLESTNRQYRNAVWRLYLSFCNFDRYEIPVGHKDGVVKGGVDRHAKGMNEGTFR
eukprot:g6563.t1